MDPPLQDVTTRILKINKWHALAAVLVIYIPIGLYLDTLPPTDPTIMYGPFEHYGGYAWRYQPSVSRAIADTAEAPHQSRLELTEDGRPLGPAHCADIEIGDIGHGRFSYRKDDWVFLYFSTSDNSNPNTNGRIYRAVEPAAADPFQSIRIPPRKPWIFWLLEKIHSHS
ncbi:hypothetical protein [Bradyrhizobium elkanii]|uniref:hypothetical protein n=1 Tax=Bradyrhizobium elkanii TaxID=29448 RepID=UPI001BADE07A|nr:hypothetical protein [Bradyrhizobium elkanii]MBR1162932.1 hypothetical protein [Bradyrhizobium elkanii]